MHKPEEWETSSEPKLGPIPPWARSKPRFLTR